MKKLIPILALIMSSSLFAQGVKIEVGAGISCPYDEESYFADYVGNNSGFNYFFWKVTGGTIIGSNTASPVRVKWNDVTQGTLTAIAMNDQNFSIGEASSNIKIYTITGISPTRPTGTNSIEVEDQSVRTYFTSQLFYKNYNKEIFDYQWEIPPGWTLIADRGTSIDVRPDNSSSGFIRVTGVSECDDRKTNPSSKLNISRYISQPASIRGASTVACLSQSPIIYSVAQVKGATSYVWTIPPGWAGSSTSNSITVTPNGTNGGTITVKAKGYNLTSSPQTKDVTLVPYTTLPVINGSSPLCTTNKTYTVSGLPAGSSVVWSVTPSSRFAVTSGSGTSFTTRASSSSTGGYSTIKATITPPCSGLPSYTIQKTIYVGKPDILSITGPSTSRLGRRELYGVTYSNYGSVSFNWFAPTGWPVTGGQGTSQAFIRSGGPTPPGTYEIGVTLTNDCGSVSGTKDVTLTGIKPPNPLTISPNPTYGDVTIQVEQEELTEGIEIMVFNKEGVLVLQDKIQNGKINLETYTLPSGLYIVKTFQNGSYQEQKLIKK